MGTATTNRKPTLVPTREAIDLAGCSAGTFYKKVKSGQVQRYVTGSDRKRVLYDLNEILAMREPRPKTR